MNAVVNDEAVVGERAIVAACAFVPAGMVVEPQMLVGGVPAKPLRKLREEEMAWKLEGTRTYQDLTRRSLASLRPVEPLPQVESDRPRVQAPVVSSLIATRRG